MIISLFFLTVSLVLLRRWASMRWVSWLVASSLLSVVVLTVVEFCLNLVTGDGVNGAVFYHMRTGLEGGDVSQYFLPLTVAAVILCGVVALTWVFRRQLYPRRQTSSLSMNGAVAVAALAAVLAHPVIVSSATYAVRFSLVEQQREGFHFVSDEPSRPDVPKNLVLIYLESVERSYLDSDRFPGLTPNLTALEKKAVSFSNLGQTAGAGFTVGGLVASQCGFPLILAGGANSMRVNQFLSGASCLGDILSNAGYHTLYLGGASTEFAGKGAFFDSHGYDEVLGLDELLPALPNQDYVAEWGLQDDTLLDIARTRFEELSSQDQPFGMALLTLDTHHPNGHAETNQACQGLQYRDGDNPMLNSVHCADALIGEFVSDIMSGPAAEDTVIAIASDHLAMVNSATDLLEAGPRRNLFMVIDSETLSDGQVVDRQVSSMDLGPTILTRLGFDVPNLGLGVDLLGAVETLPEALGVTVDNKKALDNHVMGFRDVYTRLWAFPDISEGLYVNSERGEVHFGHNAFSTPVLLAFDEDHTIEQAVLKDSQADETLSEAALNLPSGQRYIWIDKCATLLPDGHAQAGTMDDLCFFAGKRGNGANVLPVSDTRYYSAEDLEAMLGADPEGLDDTILLTGIGRRLGDLTETIALPALKTGHRGVLLQSSAFGAGASFVRRQTIDSLKAGEDWILERGVSLIGLKPDGRVEMIDRLDQCAEDFDANAHRPWAERITEMKDQFSAHIVAVHDTAFCGESIKPLEIILGDLPVKELRSSKMREAYLGVITSDGDVFEVANRTFDRSRVFLSPKPNGGGSLSASARFEPVPAPESPETNLDIAGSEPRVVLENPVLVAQAPLRGGQVSPLVAVDGESDACIVPLAQVPSMELPIISIGDFLAESRLHSSVEFSSGWWSAEGAGRWAGARRNKLRMRLPISDGPLWLEIQMAAIGGASRDVSVEFDGRELGTASVGQTDRFAFDASSLPREIPITLDLVDHGPALSCLAAQSQGADTRQMAFMLKSVALNDVVDPVGVVSTGKEMLAQSRTEPTVLRPFSLSIAQGGGRFDGISISNSFEAIRQNTPRFQVVELDFSWTSDGELVCLHDWNESFSSRFDADSVGAVAYEEFRDLLATSADKPRNCDLDGLAGWMRASPDTIVVTDVKKRPLDAYRMIARRHPDLRDQFVPQAYQPEEVDTYRQLGFQSVIWTLYRFGSDPNAVVAAALKHSPSAITMTVEMAQTGLFRAVKEQTNTPVYVHTVNDQEMAACLLAAGAAGIYSDDLDQADMIETLGAEGLCRQVW